MQSQEEFVVKESVFYNLLQAFIMIAIFIGILFTRNFEVDKTDSSSFYFLYILCLVFIVVFVKQSMKKSELLKVNTEGIFYKGTKLTNWENFVNAYIIQEGYNVNNNSAGISDKFRIDVIFYNSSAHQNYKYALSLSSTADRSSYEIIQAMITFSGKQLSFETYYDG